jgi:hypothetical protein
LHANDFLGSALTSAGVFIAALGVLFAIGAIIGAFILYYQGQEYTRKIDESIDRHRQELQASLKEYRDSVGALMATYEENFQAKLSSFDERVANGERLLATTHGHEAEAIERELEKIRTQRATIQRRTVLQAIQEASSLEGSGSPVLSTWIGPRRAYPSRMPGVAPTRGVLVAVFGGEEEARKLEQALKAEIPAREWGIGIDEVGQAYVEFIPDRPVDTSLIYALANAVNVNLSSIIGIGRGQGREP